jgi:hypothetical protein
MLNPVLSRKRAELSKKFDRAQPFRHLVVDGFLAPAGLAEVKRDVDRMSDRHFDIGHDDIGVLGVCRSELIPTLGKGFAKLNAFLSSQEMLDWVSAVSGEPGLARNPGVQCGGVFRYFDEFERDIHIDANETDQNCAQRGHTRKIHLLLYLSPEWKAEWGGALEIFKNPKLPPAHSYPPLFNRVALVDNTEISWHAVSRVMLPPEKRTLSRIVFIVNYFSKRPVRAKPGPSHCNTWMPKPLPPHIRVGRTLTMADILEARRLLARREIRLKGLRKLETDYRAVMAGRRPVPAPAKRRGAETPEIKSALSLELMPGRILTRRDLTDLRRPFAEKDKELRRLYAVQHGYIETLKARAPELLPPGS